MYYPFYFGSIFSQSRNYTKHKNNNKQLINDAFQVIAFSVFIQKLLVLFVFQNHFNQNLFNDNKVKKIRSKKQKIEEAAENYNIIVEKFLD